MAAKDWASPIHPVIPTFMKHNYLIIRWLCSFFLDIRALFAHGIGQGQISSVDGQVCYRGRVKTPGHLEKRKLLILRSTVNHAVSVRFLN
jgi:hypothetical protein